jgi:hypothetical protein
VGILERLGRLDRRYLFLVIAAAVIVPLLLRRPAPVLPSAIVEHLFDAVDRLPPGSRVLMALDYGPATVPENDPMAHAVARHALEKDLELYLVTIWATGPPAIDNLIRTVILGDFPEKRYGEDWVNLGYKVGNQGAIQSMAGDFRELYTTDVGWGDIPPRAISDIPMMHGIASARDFAMIVAVGSGFPGVKEWVQFAGDPTGVPVGGGVTAVEAPLLYPYYPQQLVGLMGGLQGAAEYERLLTEHYPHYHLAAQTALVRMFPQTVAHLVIIGFVILGNASYFAQRRRGRR